MFNIKSKKIVSSIIATLAISSASLYAQDVYATVNGKNITNKDVQKLIRNPNIKFDTLPKKNKDQVINQIIDKELLSVNAVKSGIEKEKEYKKALSIVKKELALELWMKKQFNKIKVTEKDKKDYFNKNKANFKIPAQLEARHILVKTEKEAKDIIQTLNKASNKKDEFEKLAKTKSIGPSKTKGGYLGKFPENKMVPEFSKAAKALKVGTYSKTPVKTQFGYHVIYLENKTAAKNLTYKEVEKRIEQGLKQLKFRTQIKKKSDSLRKKAKIVIK